MTDYYSKFDFITRAFRKEDARKVQTLFFDAMDAADVDDDDKPVDVGCTVRDEGNEVRFFSDQQPNIPAFNKFLQFALSEYAPDMAIGYEVTLDASNGTTKAYGGLAYWITAGEVQEFSTRRWLADTKREHSISRALAPKSLPSIELMMP